MSKQITEEQLIEQFDDFLDAIYPEAKIGTHSFLPSQVLKNTDPIAYRTDLADYADALSRDGFEVEGY